MKTMRLLLVALMVCAGMFSAPIHATGGGTDQSDLWWNPNESGWGIQLVDRAGSIFATMYVYGPSGQPTWYTALINFQGGFTWSGDLYASSGPWFGAIPYNPAAFATQKVGTLTWTASYVNQAILTYSVNGTTVTKTVYRTFIAQDNYSGNFLGAIHQATSGCSTPALNGTAEAYASFAVSQSGTNVTLHSNAQSGLSCNFNGALSQGGALSEIDGTYSCSTGEAGNFQLYELTINDNSLSGRFIANSTNNGCQSTGYLSGMPSTGGASGATTFPLQQAVTNLQTSGFQKTLSLSGSAISNGISYPVTGSWQLTESSVAGGASFAGQPALQQSIAITGPLYVNGQTDYFANTGVNYFNTNHALVGQITPTLYCVANSPGQYPTSVTIGQTGPYVTLVCYADSTRTALVETFTESFSISAGTSSTTATVSAIAVAVNAQGQQVESAQTNYLIDTSGNLTFQYMTLNETAYGVTLNLLAQ